MGIHIIRTTTVATVNDAAGISKFGVKFRSMVLAWSVLNGAYLDHDACGPDGNKS